MRRFMLRNACPELKFAHGEVAKMTFGFRAAATRYSRHSF